MVDHARDELDHPAWTFFERRKTELLRHEKPLGFAVEHHRRHRVAALEHQSPHRWRHGAVKALEAEFGLVYLEEVVQQAPAASHLHPSHCTPPAGALPDTASAQKHVIYTDCAGQLAAWS